MGVAVTVVELVGMVGSGKTTIARELPEMLASRGITAYTGKEALAVCMDRSWLGPLTRRLAGTHSDRVRINLAIYRRLVRPLFVLAFTLSYPRAVFWGLRAPGTRAIPRLHRRKVRQLFLRMAALIHFVRPRLAEGEVVVLEEGTVHRAVNLFAWGEVDRAITEKFLDALPPSDLIISVEAPLPVCLERTEGRGLPRRLTERDERTIGRFMENAAGIIEIVGEWLERSPSPVITVFNGGRLEEALGSLLGALDRYAPSRS